MSLRVPFSSSRPLLAFLLVMAVLLAQDSRLCFHYANIETTGSPISNVGIAHLENLLDPDDDGADGVRSNDVSLSIGLLKSIFGFSWAFLLPVLLILGVVNQRVTRLRLTVESYSIIGPPPLLRPPLRAPPR